jgi:L-asparaginase II
VTPGLGSVELLHVSRGGIVESGHRGSLVLLAGSGKADVVIGEVEAPRYPRSALKPLQTVAMLAAGLTGPPQTIALASASHQGEPVHVAGARATLAAAGLDETALQCPPDLPGHPPALVAWVRAGGGPAAICHNCSGKHAAMLATCVAAGWDPATYLDPAHPLQRAIVTHVERLGGAPIAVTSVDGCGAPAHAMPMVALARAFATLTTAEPGSPERLVADAMRAHPMLISGTGSPVSELCAEVPGLLAKNGAEGVWAAALPDGRAFAAKVDDGGARALGPVLATALRFWGFDGPAVRRWAAVPVLGGGRPVGVVAAAPTLLERLALPAR